MSEILRDLSNEPVTDANLENIYASSPFYYDLPGNEICKDGYVCWVMSDIPFNPCNIVFKARFSESEVEPAVGEIVAKAMDKKTPLKWIFDRETTPSNLGDTLKKFGFVSFDRPSTLMAVDVNIPEPEIPHPAGMKIVEVTDLKELEAWNNVATTGFGGNAEAAERNYRWFTRIMNHNLPSRFYLAYVDGKPAATSQLVPAAGVGGVFYVATLPEYRNRGLGYAVTLKAVEDAKALGYKVATLQASNMGEPVYRRMGWWKCGETMVYMWKPPV